MTTSIARRLAATTLLATLAVAFSGCSADQGASSDKAGSSAGIAAGDAALKDSPEPAAARNAGIVENAAQTRSVIATGSVNLRGDDVQAARDEVAAIVAAHGGTIDDERSSSDRKGVLRTSRLVLRIPSSDFTAALGELKKVAELKSVTSKAEDVTTQVIDNRVRVAAQERSIKRIAQLLDRAQSIRDIMAIEGQLTSRQAALESLQSQQAWLTDQTSLATITVSIDRTDVPAAKADRTGFLAGLSAGWHGLTATVVGILTVLGAVLPFAVVIGLLAWPVWFVIRRFVRRPAPAATPTPET